MKILHILNDGASELSEQIISAQSNGNDLKVIDLRKKEVTYEALIDEIFEHDRVISW